MAKVFISYSRKNIEFAKRLTGELQKSELDFWVDWEGIPPTVDWWMQIEKGIEEADVFLFLISPDSVKSKICIQEIDYAIKNGKRLIPLMVRDVKGDDIPAQLSHINWIFFREEDDFDTALGKLLTSIRTDYEWVQAHRRLQVKALEWERNSHEHSFLLRGKDLQDAELQLATNTSKEPHPTDLQREFVFASRKAADRQRGITTGISITGVIILVALSIYSFAQAAIAKKETRRATASNLALESRSALEDYPQRALLLALESIRINQEANEPVLPAAEESLRFAIEQVPGTTLYGFDYPVDFIHFANGVDGEPGKWLIAGSDYAPTTEAAIWNMDKLLNDPAYEPAVINVPADTTGESIFYPLIKASPQDTWLVTNATDGYSLWHIADADESRTPISFQAEPIFIDPKDDTLILEQQAEQAILWRVNPDSLEKQEVGRVDGQYIYTSPQNIWVVIQTANGQSLWPVSGSDTERPLIEFKGEPLFVNVNDDQWVLEQQEGQAILWKVDSAAVQKKEIQRFEGKYAAASPDFEYIVTQNTQKNLLLWETDSFENPTSTTMQIEYDRIVIDSENRWMIVFEAVTHPEMLIPVIDEMGVSDGTQPWVSTTLNIFALNNLEEPAVILPMDEHGYSRQFSSNGNMLIFSTHTIPDSTYGSSTARLGAIRLNEETPSVQIEKMGNPWGNAYPLFINDHWLIDLEGNRFFDLRDDDMESDITTGQPLDFGYYGDVPAKLIFAENGKYLILQRERINLDLLDETRTLVVEPNPDASPSQTDITKLLKFHPLTLGVEGEAIASALSPDGNWLVGGTADGSLRLWNNKRPWASSLQIDDLSGNTYMTLSNNNQWLATGSTLWSLEDGTPTTPYQIDNDKAVGYIGVGVFSPDSRWFIHLKLSGNQVKINDINGSEYDIQEVHVSLIDMTQNMTPTTLQTTLISQPGNAYSTVQFSPNSQWALISGPNSSFVIKLEDRSSYPLPNYYDAVFTPDQNHIILIPPANKLDPTPGSPEVWALPSTPGGSVEKIGSIDAQGYPAISRNGRWLITLKDFGPYEYGPAEETKIWDINCVINGYECTPFSINTSRAAFSPDSRYLILGWANDENSSFREYEIWDMQPWEKDQNAQPVKIESGTTPHYDINLGNTGGLIVLQSNESCDYGGRPTSTAVLSSAWDKNPWLANLSTFDGYAYLQLFGGGGGGGGEVTYHTDYQADILVRDGEQYQPLTLRGHESSITAVQVSPNERYVLTFSGGTATNCSEQRENLLRLWDTEKMIDDPLSKPVILPLKYDDKTTISHLAFSPDSNWVYVIDSNNVLYYFSMHIESLQEKACNIAGRNFILNEWERFFPYDAYRKTCENLSEHPSVFLETTPTAAP